MKNLIAKFSVLVVIAMTQHAQAASFDCEKAGNKIERTICQDAEISQLDEDLSKAYKVVRKKEKAVVKDGTGVGLNNIASRYALLTIDKMTIEKANGLFKVNLPLLDKNKLNTHNKQIMETSIQDIKLTKAKEQVQGIKNSMMML